MIIKKRVNYQHYNDQELIDLFEQSRDRDAVAELYERYRVSLGNYLYRDIKSKAVVADVFNTIMLRLITDSSSQASSCRVSTKLFAMAYSFRTEYTSANKKKSNANAATTSTQDANCLGSKLANLPRLHRDVLELVYKYNFNFDEAAQVIGCSTSVVRNCWASAKDQNQPANMAW